MPGVDAPSPIQEQLHRRRNSSVGRYGQRLDGVYALTPDIEAAAAGDQQEQSICGGQEVGQIARRVSELFHVVQHDQYPCRCQPVGDTCAK